MCLQELPPLGEPHGIESRRKLGVVGEFLTRYLNLLVSVHEKPIQCVLREQEEEEEEVEEDYEIEALPLQCHSRSPRNERKCQALDLQLPS